MKVTNADTKETEEIEGETEKVNTLEIKAKATFVSLLKYMGEMFSPYPESEISVILGEGILNPCLVDEIYMGVMMQCSNNETGNLKRAWQLVRDPTTWTILRHDGPNHLEFCALQMSLCVKTFPPSVDFRPYVEVFFYHASHGACGGGREKDKIIQASQVALRKLEQIMKDGAWSEKQIR